VALAQLLALLSLPLLSLVLALPSTRWRFYPQTLDNWGELTLQPAWTQRYPELTETRFRSLKTWCRWALSGGTRL
jgi:hypothetical protein